MAAGTRRATDRHSKRPQAASIFLLPRMIAPVRAAGVRPHNPRVRRSSAYLGNGLIWAPRVSSAGRIFEIAAEELDFRGRQRRAPFLQRPCALRRRGQTRPQRRTHWLPALRTVEIPSFQTRIDRHLRIATAAPEDHFHAQNLWRIHGGAAGVPWRCRKAGHRHRSLASDTFQHLPGEGWFRSQSLSTDCAEKRDG